MKDKKIYVLPGIIALVGLLNIIIGTSIAIFNYTKTGAENTINVGRISFVTRETKMINLTNLFPIDPTEPGIMDDETKVGTIEIEISGDTDYDEGLEYLISSENTNITTTKGNTVPISLDMSIENLGSSNSNYFTARENKNATIYKKLVGDTLVGDQMLLVGFIKPNTTSGIAEGIINGKITIKAYLDVNKILISDTYDGTESGSMGTPNSMAEGKTVLTTEEWNNLVSQKLSFHIKVEANQGLWVKGSLEEIMFKNNIGIDTESGVDFNKTSGQDNTKGVYMRAGTQNDSYPIMYYRGAVEDNNVLFANKCWKTVRTTDTGGVKLIYNGEYTDENKCNNIELASQITINESGVDTNIFSFSNSDLVFSPAYLGYMYGTPYEFSNSNWKSGSRFGSSFTWDGTHYTLVDPSATQPNATHHYSCNSNIPLAACTELRYVFFANASSTLNGIANYITLQNGKSVEDAIREMQTNTTNSNAKSIIEKWYASNLTSYTNRIEDTIYCNDRNMNTLGNDQQFIDNGWNANGGNLRNNRIYYMAYGRVFITKIPSLSCTNKNDAFTWKKGNGNQKLQYPVGMLTGDEIMLAGGLAGESNSTFYLNSRVSYVSLSPSFFNGNNSSILGVDAAGRLGALPINGVGLRPSISLKPGLLVKSGDGTVSSPYVIK